MSDNTLKPCPFCGGKVTPIETRAGYGELYCGNCDVVMAGNEPKTPEELIEAWNTRHERTCIYTLEYDREEMERREKMYAENPFGMFPQDMPASCWTCSECGQQFKTHYRRDNDGAHLLPIPDWIKYCPNCGAKVVCE